MKYTLPTRWATDPGIGKVGRGVPVCRWVDLEGPSSHTLLARQDLCAAMGFQGGGYHHPPIAPGHFQSHLDPRHGVQAQMGF